MSSNYNGRAANISRPGSISIASSTNTTPIVVTTAAAHGLTDQDSLVIGGHQVNTAANGRWIANVLSTTTFSLKKIDGTNSVGNGVGVATGTVYPQNMGAVYPVPSDGDDEDGASVEVPLQALGDRTAWVGRQVAAGAYQPVLVQSQSISDTEPPTFSAIGTITGTNIAAAWHPFQISSVTQVWTIPNLCQGDVVALDFTTSAAQSGFVGGGANALIALFIQQVSAGGSLGSPVRMGGSGQMMASTIPAPLHLKGVATMNAFNGDPGGSLLVVVQGYMPASAADVVTFYSEAELAYSVFRPNA